MTDHNMSIIIMCIYMLKSHIVTKDGHEKLNEHVVNLEYPCS
jgi:hypothetical protein